MQVYPINNQHNQSFSFKELPSQTIKTLERATGLTYKEMTELSLDEARQLMIKRGTLKEPSKLKLWLAKKYKEIGEQLGLLEKHYNIYTDID